MHFCPFCGTLLLVQHSTRENVLVCSTCTYIHPVETTLTVNHDFTRFNRQGVDTTDAFNGGGAGNAEGAQTITIACPSSLEEMPSSDGSTLACRSQQAYFVQVQMRGGDEPQTTFYKCCECDYQWRQE